VQPFFQRGVAAGLDRSFFDPNEGELIGPQGQFWTLLWQILSKTELSTYFPNNIVSIDRYHKH
jgi:hypothetical protein